MNEPRRNLMVRLAHAPLRLAQEVTRSRQRHERAMQDRHLVRPHLDMWGDFREARLDQINVVREVKKLPNILRYRPGPLEEDHWSARRINFLAGSFPRWSRYLEIGVFEGRTLENVKIRRRVGVDPAPRFDLDHLPHGARMHVTTSDAFFANAGPGVRFDVAFIDGLHTAQQTYRDVINTFAHVARGPVLIDDTVPLDEISAIPDQEESYRQRDAAGLRGRQWHGDVWRVVVLLERHHDELEWRTITGEGNPQTLVWRRRYGTPIVSATASQIAEAMEPSYRETFAGGTPDFFHSMSESQALDECVAGLTA